MIKKICCVVVTYNRKFLLAEAIESIHRQKYPVSKIIIIDNASTDGSKEYLEKKDLLKPNVEYRKLDKNMGGSAGFYYGLKYALNEDVDWINLSDDDAIMDSNYFSKIIDQINVHPNVKAFTGTVMMDNKIQFFHRRNITSYYTLKHSVSSKGDYASDIFYLDSFSFVGCLISKDIIKKIGLPEIDYFTQLDDTEYSLRVRKETKIINVNNAIIDHKTKLVQTSEYKPDWKEYYSIRNQCFMLLKHSQSSWFAHFYFVTLIAKKMCDTLFQHKYKKYRLYRIHMLGEVLIAVLKNKRGISEKHLPG